ncbi:hypothetical protein D3C75_637970 [compost metagenome]
MLVRIGKPAVTDYSPIGHCHVIGVHILVCDPEEFIQAAVMLRSHSFRITGPGKQRLTVPSGGAAAFAGGVGVCIEGKGFERTVLHQLGIDPAIRCIINILIEQAVHHFADIQHFLIAMNGQRVRRQMLRKHGNGKAFLNRNCTSA